MSIPAVILAAGASRRLGSPKQLEILGGETLLERTITEARESGCSPVIVVLGAESAQILRTGVSGGVTTIINNDWQEGMGSSIRSGVSACGVNVEGVVIMSCDQPAVTARHLQLLMGGPDIKASRYAEKNGVPAYFPKKYFSALMEIQGDIGARELLYDACSVPLKYGELDVDTEADLICARELFG